MNTLFILDPIKKLDPEWDSSLYVLKALWARGHSVFFAEAGSIKEEKGRVLAKVSEAGVDHLPRQKSPSFRQLLAARTILKPAGDFQTMEAFDLVVLRPEPPFDEAYRRLTSLLEAPAQKIPIVNHPRGIRNTNEKMAILNFPEIIPETIISNSPETILIFQRQIESDLVIKPLYEKGGKGVFLLKRGETHAAGLLKEATASGKTSVVAQEFIPLKKDHGDKRITLLNGEILCVYEKWPPPGDFRSNLGLGGTAHRTEITDEDKKIVERIKPYLLKEGLYWVGLDVLEGRLLEMNVTCPAGISEAEELQPEHRYVEALADFLEGLSRKPRN